MCGKRSQVYNEELTICVCLNLALPVRVQPMPFISFSLQFLRWLMFILQILLLYLNFIVQLMLYFNYCLYNMIDKDDVPYIPYLLLLLIYLITILICQLCKFKQDMYTCISYPTNQSQCLLTSHFIKTSTPVRVRKKLMVVKHMSSLPTQEG